MDTDIIIDHNPDCDTSRNTLGLMRNCGIEPHVIKYRKTPPSRAMPVDLISRMTGSARNLLRAKGTPFAELGLGDGSLSDEALIDEMLAHPILINRPIVVTLRGVKLCRPLEAVLDLLPRTQRGELRKDDGELLIDAHANRVG
jgi:arsenate reductase (glutaredoxin)